MFDLKVGIFLDFLQEMQYSNYKEYLYSVQYCRILNMPPCEFEYDLNILSLFIFYMRDYIHITRNKFRK